MSEDGSLKEAWDSEKFIYLSQLFQYLILVEYRAGLLLNALSDLRAAMMHAEGRLRAQMILRGEENHFAICANKSSEWLKALLSKPWPKPATKQYIKSQLSKFDSAEEVRDMREHEIEYLTGRGRNQRNFMVERSIQNETTGEQEVFRSDASSTVVAAGKYLIGGRLCVQDIAKTANEMRLFLAACDEFNDIAEIFKKIKC